MNDTTSEQLSGNSVILGPDQNIAFDFGVLGTPAFRWPAAPLLHYDLHMGWTHFAIQQYAVNPTPGNKALFLKKGLYLWMAQWLYLRHLQNIIQKQNIPGLSLLSAATGIHQDSIQHLVTSRYDQTGRLKRFIFRNLQIVGMRIVDALRLPRPLLRINNIPLPKTISYAWDYRIRNPYCFLDRPEKLNADEEQSLQETMQKCREYFQNFQEEHRMEVSMAEFSGMLEAVMLPQMRTAIMDYKYLYKILHGRPLDCFLGSLGGYTATLLAMIAKETGGRVHSNQHADYPYWIVNALTLVDLVNADMFYCRSRPAAHRFMAGIQDYPVQFNCRINHIESAEWHHPLINTHPFGGKIRSIMVMGTPITPELPRCNLAMAIILDFHIRLIRLLQSWGYRVIYKAHPDGTWKNEESLFGANVPVERRPYEHVWHEADACLILLSRSTTTMLALRTDRPIYYFWHPDIDPYSLAAMDLWRRRCEVLDLTFDAANRMLFDEARLQATLADPKPLDVESILQLTT
ncbi:MAG: hypothetical protein HQL65_17560 [Magnetococcales bacterium]|nr:hypothetical protein [Magnetococcales bacterium]